MNTALEKVSVKLNGRFAEEELYWGLSICTENGGKNIGGKE